VSLPGQTSTGSVAFLPDGRRLAVTGAVMTDEGPQTRRVVLDAATGAALPDESAAAERVRAVSPDGRRQVVVTLRTGEGTNPRTRETIVKLVEADGKELWTKQLPAVVGRFRFSPDGARVAALPVNGFPGSGAVRVWDVATGADLPAPVGLTADLAAAAFRPDGRFVTLDAGGAVKTWDLAPPPPPVPMVVRVSVGIFGNRNGVTPDGRFSVAQQGGNRFGTRPEADGDPRLVVTDESGRGVLRVPLPAEADVFSGVPHALSPDGSKLAVGSVPQSRRGGPPVPARRRRF
jgi:dipeptidyl aminopeptidase/acylaminoacyl peptidase